MYYRNTKEFCSDSSRSQIFRNIAYTNVNIILAKFLEKKPNGQWVSINAKTDFLRIETQLLSFLGKRPGASVHVYPMPSLFQSLSNVEAPCLDSAPSAGGIHKSDVHELTLQNPAAVFSDQHHVLPADPCPHSGKYRPGSTVTIIPGSSGVLLRPLRLGPIMGFQSDAMPEPMRKGFGNAERLEVPSGRLIHITGQNTGMDSPDSLVLRFLYGLQRLFEALRRLFADPRKSWSDRNSSLPDGTPHPPAQDFPPPEGRLWRAGSAGAPRWGHGPTNARKGQLGRPVMPEKHFNVPRDGGFASPGNEHAGQPLHHLLVQAAGNLHTPDLFRIFDHAKPFNQTVSL